MLKVSAVQPIVGIAGRGARFWRLSWAPSDLGRGPDLSCRKA